MLSELIPECPRLHPGMMVSDDSPRCDREWVCRCCGTRLYADALGVPQLPQANPEPPTKEGMGNLTGRPRNNQSRYRYMRDDSAGGKWYE